MILFFNIDFTFRANPPLVPARAGHEAPAGNRKIQDRGAIVANILRTPSYFPTGSNGEELFDPSDIQPLLAKESSQAFQPLKIIVRIIALPAPPRRLYKPFLLVYPKRPWMNIEQFRYDSNRINSLPILNLHYRSPIKKRSQGHF
jgi:hypothetical protein